MKMVKSLLKFNREKSNWVDFTVIELLNKKSTYIYI